VGTEGRGNYWWVIVNRVLKPGVAAYEMKMLTGGGTAGLSSRAVLDGVS
jgi:hypothetical protein